MAVKTTVEQYVAAHGHQIGFPQDRLYRSLAESWYPAAQQLATMPDATLPFQRIIRKELKGRLFDDDIVITTPAVTRPLLHLLQEHQLLTILHESEESLTSLIHDSDKRMFLSGEWLKVFVWHTLLHTDNCDDCQWGQRITANNTEFIFDVSCTAHDQLFLVLCNTMPDPLAKAQVYFGLLDRISNFLGTDGVHKYFATFHPQPETLPGYPSFHEQAQQRNITVITGQELPHIGKILTAHSKYHPSLDPYMTNFNTNTKKF